MVRLRVLPLSPTINHRLTHNPKHSLSAPCYLLPIARHTRERPLSCRPCPVRRALLARPPPCNSRAIRADLVPLLFPLVSNKGAGLPLRRAVTSAIDRRVSCEIVPRPPRPDKGEEEENCAGLFAPSGEFHLFASISLIIRASARSARSLKQVSHKWRVGSPSTFSGWYPHPLAQASQGLTCAGR